MDRGGCSGAACSVAYPDVVPSTVRQRVRFAVLVGCGAIVLTAPAGLASAQEAAPPTTVPGPAVPAPAEPAAPTPEPVTGDRRWLVPVPTGCTVPDLPTVVFVGTLMDIGTPAGMPAESQYDTARFHVDQVRAGSPDRITEGGLIDVRFGIDAKYLDTDEQYLVGAGLDPNSKVLVSKLSPPEPAFGGDDVIGAAENDVTCPSIVDPIRTVHVDGSPVDDSVVGPFMSAKGSLARAFVLPLAVAFAVIFGLAALRWLLTGVGKGVGSVVRSASEPGATRLPAPVGRDIEHSGRP